jgi:hypothetical protein
LYEFHVFSLTLDKTFFPGNGPQLLLIFAAEASGCNLLCAQLINPAIEAMVVDPQDIVTSVRKGEGTA